MLLGIGACLGLLWGVLGDHWQAVDRYLPGANKAIHAGTPTTENDIDYRLGKLFGDDDEFWKGCTQETDIKQCREYMLSHESLLLDEHEQMRTFMDFWNKAKEGSAPVKCQGDMDHLMAVYADYLKAEDNAVHVLKSIHPESQSGARAGLSALNDAITIRNTAYDKAQSMRAGKCDGLSGRDGHSPKTSAEDDIREFHGVRR
jgi:deoxyribodipyrimidine photolyase